MTLCPTENGKGGNLPVASSRPLYVVGVGQEEANDGGRKVHTTNWIMLHRREGE